MTRTNSKPLGELLTSAGLISEGQLQTALYDQQAYQDMRLGEILATRGWLHQKTADFFYNFLQKEQRQQIHLHLGEFLVEAALISKQQIQQILDEQNINHLRFGSLAVLKGYISQRTLDFFLTQLCAVESSGKSYLQSNLDGSAAKMTVGQNYRATTPQKQALATKETLSRKTQSPQQMQQATKEVEINWI